MTGLFGGAFDPPHNGHVALVQTASDHFALERVVILVSEAPGHKAVHAPVEARLRLARAAFPGYEVELDPFARTVDMLRARTWDDPLFLVGADQLGAFWSWKEPEAVLELTRLGVATRPGYTLPPDMPQNHRIVLFEVPAVDVSSSEVRRRVAEGQPVGGLVPPAVAALIEELGIYRRGSGLH